MLHKMINNKLHTRSYSFISSVGTRKNLREHFLKQIIKKKTNDFKFKWQIESNFHLYDTRKYVVILKFHCLLEISSPTVFVFSLNQTIC